MIIIVLRFYVLSIKMFIKKDIYFYFNISISIIYKTLSILNL